jgi:hypothetical protein
VWELALRRGGIWEEKAAWTCDKEVCDCKNDRLTVWRRETFCASATFSWMLCKNSDCEVPLRGSEMGMGIEASSQLAKI